MNTSCFFSRSIKNWGKRIYRLSSFLHIPYAFLDVVIKCDILDNNQSPNLLMQFFAISMPLVIKMCPH